MGRQINPVKKQLATSLRLAAKKSGRGFWTDVLERLESQASQMPQVNLSKISTLTQVGDVVLVPGKVLGSGLLDHQIHIGAFAFSGVAVEKIRRAKGEPLSIQAFLQRFVDHKGLIILG